jgi:hypothetical protein
LNSPKKGNIEFNGRAFSKLAAEISPALDFGDVGKALSSDLSIAQGALGVAQGAVSFQLVLINGEIARLQGPHLQRRRR